MRIIIFVLPAILTHLLNYVYKCMLCIRVVDIIGNSQFCKKLVKRKVYTVSINIGTHLNIYLAVQNNWKRIGWCRWKKLNKTDNVFVIWRGLRWWNNPKLYYEKEYNVTPNYKGLQTWVWYLRLKFIILNNNCPK